MLKSIVALTALLAAVPQTAPNPNLPTPTLDKVAPRLPALKRPAILIFSKTNSYRHDSIPAAVAAVEKRVRARGWSAYATENAAVFNPAALAATVERSVPWAPASAIRCSIEAWPATITCSAPARPMLSATAGSLVISASIT